MFNKRKRPNDITDNLITDFSSSASEAIQKLQTSISFAFPDNPGPKVIGVVSSVQAEGKSTLAVNLANIYAARGAKVCLVNLDIRRPSIHRFFGIKNDIGIVEYVTGDEPLEKVIRHTAQGVDIINSGSKTPFPTKILSSPKMNEAFDSLKKMGYDYIIADNAPVLLVTDALLTSSYTDGFLFVASQHISKKKDTANGLNILKNAKINVIGIVMTEVTDFRDAGDSSNGYYYYYGDGKHYHDKKRAKSHPID